MDTPTLRIALNKNRFIIIFYLQKFQSSQFHSSDYRSPVSSLPVSLKTVAVYSSERIRIIYHCISQKTTLMDCQFPKDSYRTYTCESMEGLYVSITRETLCYPQPNSLFSFLLAVCCNTNSSVMEQSERLRTQYATRVQGGGVVRRVGKSRRRKQMSDERSYLSARRWRLKTRAQRNAVRVLNESYWFSETQISNFLLAERRKYKTKKKIVGGNRIVCLLKSILFSFVRERLNYTCVNATYCTNVYHLR